MSNRIYRTLGTVAMEPKGEYDSTVYYEKLNVVTYNGSSYMAIEPSTGVLPTNTEYWQLIAKSSGNECEFIFPGQWGLSSASGNSNIVKIKDKVLLFDTNSTTVYSYLLDMLEENNITHIDYLILTHYDSDHRGNINSLIDDGYLDENSYFIHPECLVEIYGQSIKNWSDALEERCSEIGITSIIPEENQVISITYELSLRFGNVDSEYALEHYSNPNMCTMVTEINHNGFYSLMMGDALYQTEQHLVDIGFIKNEIGLYTIPHHAIEASCYVPFYNLINPKFAIAQAQNGHYNLNLFTTNQSSALLEEKGCVNYFSYNNPTNIKFIEKSGNIECVNGIPTVHSGKSFDVFYIYCDSVNYDESKQDGSEEYPFKDLPQALGMIKDWNNANVFINLKPGTYGFAYTGTGGSSKNTCHITSRNNYIVITGEDVDTTIIDKGISVKNCANVRINNVTIKPSGGDEKNCVYALASRILFVGCKFVGNELTNYVGNGIRTAYMSDIICVNCDFSYLDIAYKILGGTRLRTNKDTINYLNTFVYSEESSDISIGTIKSSSDLTTITNFDNYDSSKTIQSNPRKMEKGVTNIMLGDIVLPVPSTNFIYEYLVIHYALRDNSTIIGRGKKIIPFTNVSNLKITESIIKSANTISVFALSCDLQGDTITISSNYCTNIASDGTLTTNSPNSASDTTYGVQISKIELI